MKSKALDTMSNVTDRGIVEQIFKCNPIRFNDSDFFISLGMIDRWSFGHLFTVVAVGCVQVIMLRRLFNVKPTSHKLSARA